MDIKISKNYTYILRCIDDTFYTGWTNNLEKRIRAHNNGTGSKYTRGRLPVSLAYSEVFDSKEEAVAREYKIKRLTREKKMELVNKSNI